MREITYKHLTSLILAGMAVLAMAASTASILILYRTAYNQTLEEMRESAGALAGIMEAVAQFDIKYSAHTHPQGSWGATMSQIEQGLSKHNYAYQTEELIITRREGNSFLILRRSSDRTHLTQITSIPLEGTRAEPARRSLLGKTGSMEAIDYRGEIVLAGYSPVPSLGIGVVYKIDLAEMRAPYIRAGLWVLSISVALIIGAGIMVLFVVRPAQQHAEHSEQRLQAILNFAPVGVYETDSQGHCIYVNEQWYHITGLQPDEALGEGWTHALHPEDRETVFAASVEFLAGRAPFYMEYRFQHRDGKVVWVYGQASAVKNTAGEITGYSGTITDITDQKQNQLLTQQAMLRLNEAQALAKVGSWELDLGNNNLIWSDEIFRMFEVDKAKFGASYEAFLNAIHPEDRDIVNNAYSNSLATRKPYEIVHRLQMSNGRIKWVRETCESYFDETGKPLRSVGTVQDITELHAVELELRRHREQLEEQIAERTREIKDTNQMLHAVLDTAPLRIFWKDKNLNYLGCNRVFAQDAGKQKPQDLIGKSDYDMPWNATADLYRDDDARVIRTGESKLAFEEPMDFPDGSRVWLSTNKVPLRNADGEIIGVLGTYENITARKLAQQELIAAKETAERASKAKSEFLSHMSHELRTPMNAILGFAQVLEMEELGPEQVEFVNEIHRAGSHLLELINELLDLSRIESGKLTTVLQPVKVKAVVTDACQIARPIMAEQQIQMSNQCDDNATVLADPMRLKQILVNLLSNAAKYNRVGGRIVIACSPMGDNWLRIAVTDTGPGIAPEKQERLFMPFERLGAEFSAIDGTGIGLALSHQLAELMGGQLGIDSTPGEGSTFWIDLPLAVTQSITTKDASKPLAAVDNDTQRINVLYVEDNAANLRVVEAMLRHQTNLRLLSATNGEFGLELAKRYLPEIILLDIHLPGMDGYIVLDALKADPKTKNIPVIALSADAMPIDIEKGLQAGFKLYLTKPLKVAELMKAIDSVTAGLLGNNPRSAAS